MQIHRPSPVKLISAQPFVRTILPDLSIETVEMPTTRAKLLFALLGCILLMFYLRRVPWSITSGLKDLYSDERNRDALGYTSTLADSSGPSILPGSRKNDRIIISQVRWMTADSQLGPFENHFVHANCCFRASKICERRITGWNQNHFGLKSPNCQDLVSLVTFSTHAESIDDKRRAFCFSGWHTSAESSLNPTGLKRSIRLIKQDLWKHTKFS